MTTHAEWREHLRQDLGGGGVDVELIRENYDTALRRAVQLWNRHRPHLKWLNLGVLSGGTSYLELTESEVGSIGILDIRYTDSGSGPLAPTSSVWELQVRWGRRGARMFFKRWTDLRRMERFTGTQPDWWWDPTAETLYLYNPSRPVKAMALFTIPRVPYGEDIRYDEESMFEQLALGYAKILAADILEQAGEVPGPSGSIGSNAAIWRERGQDDIDKVTEKLENSLRSVPPPIWVG